MKQYLFRTLVVAGASSLLLASCASKFKISSTGVNVDPNPLTVQGDAVKTRINFAFPKKSFPKKGTLRITPVLRYAGGEKWGKAYDYQGDDVYGNEQVVFYKSGANAVLDFAVPYTPQMQKSELYLTFNGKVGKKAQKISSMKVADGVNATETLATVEGILPAIAPHGFQRVVKEMYDADILFQIQQANVRGTEINKEDVEEWRYTVQNAKETPNQNVSVEVQSYASPDGGKKLNEKLSENRERNTTAALKKEFKKQDMAGGAIDAHYTAQDWEGFQKLVQVSNIQDKDVILRVLSMYKDPQEREQQIRNMSEGFRELANGILPELRRARLVINYEVVGRSDDEIAEQYKKDPVKLSADELLYYATLVDDTKTEEVYQTAASLYDKDYRAFNNLATLELKKGNEIKAKSYLEQALRVNSKAPEALANLGLIDLMHGNLAQAEVQIANASGTNNTAYATAALAFAKGKYADAERDLADSNTNLAALAHLMNNNYAAAAQTLDEVKHKTAYTHYIHAIVAARRGNKFSATSHLEEALKLNPSLKTYADKDLELKIIK